MAPTGNKMSSTAKLLDRIPLVIAAERVTRGVR